ncbi:LamG-like jellyroll fold domain-containing protein [Umezawaea beigongshangensis]|uniref:LamG-like jellyroll fold domain-containing protein n=1 Tax=Umezawaea beigongshangensis TaxID=2780383 RepID=UPI0018F1880A|nr:LamG-like jellyroll fold domain-containing protein [Umezawaea beigongshangensis]
MWYDVRRLGPLLLVLLLALPSPATASGVSPSQALVGVQQVLFRGGTAGYGCFRIPVLSRTVDGTLLAFAEARKSPSCADRGDIDLVVRRSTNDGRTWGPIRVVTSGSPTDPHAPYTRGNAVPIADRETGRVHLITTSNEATRSGQRLPWIQHSDDDGLTWTAPRALGASFDGTNDGWFATGPSHGIQLRHGAHAGRLVVGAHQKPDGNTVLAGVLYSDDGGETWRASRVPNSYVKDQLSPGEIAVAELPDGALYAAARNEITSGNHRAKAISLDGGTTMPTFTTVPSLVTPNVQGAVLPLERTYRSTPGDVLVFSGPSDPSDRKQLKIRYSTDRGNTWSSPASGLITADRAGYSDLAELTGGEIGLLHEGGATFSADEIRFTRFTPAQLGLPGTTTGTPSAQPSTPAGPTSPDASPEANDAHLAGDAALDDGLLLDGTGDHADVPYSRTIDPGGGDFTLRTRFRYSATAASPAQALLWAYGVGADVPQVWVRAQPGTDRITAWVQGRDGGATAAVVDPAARVAFGDGAWHQLTLTRTGSRIDLTVDGATATATGVLGAVSSGVSGIRLGAKQDATASDGFTGRLRDFQLVRDGRTTLSLALRTIDGAVVPARTVTPVTDDVSGNCSTGTLLGGHRTAAAGRTSNSDALHVDSTHPGVETPFTPALDLGAGDFTFAAWFRYSATASSPNQALVWAYGTTAGKRSLWVRAQPGQDRLYAWVQTDTAQVAVPLADTTAGTAFGDGAWHLLALTRQGQRVALSVDGGTPATATGLTGSVSADTADAVEGLRLGSKMDGTDVLDGTLEDFRLYDRALSSAELGAAATGRFPGDAPALWWTFDQQNTQAHEIVQPVTGPRTPDSSAHCVHTAVSGGPAVVPGRFGNALRFDGADDAALVPYRPSTALGSGDFTISTWVKYPATASTADQVLLWAYGSGSSERGLWLRAQPGRDRLYAYLQTDTGTFEVAAPDASPAAAFGDDTWHHVTLRRSGNVLALLVDGVGLGSTTVSGSVTHGDAFAVDGLQLGVKPDGTDRFAGVLDEFQVHRTALGDAALADLRANNTDLGPVTAVRLSFTNAS